MARRLGNWLTSYLELVKNTEPHTRFHIWVGLMLVATTLGRKTELVMGPEVIFPNLYIVLVSQSPEGSTYRCNANYSKTLCFAGASFG